MTNTQLKAQIDAAITNKTTSKSITPTDVGSNTKAVVDYIDQQVTTTPVHTLQQVTTAGNLVTSGTNVTSISASNITSSDTSNNKSTSVSPAGLNITWTGIGATNIAANGVTSTNATNNS